MKLAEIDGFVLAVLAECGGGRLSRSEIAAQLSGEGAALESSDLKHVLPRLVQERLVASRE